MKAERKINQTECPEEQQLPQAWQERVIKAAEMYNLPIPSTANMGSPQEVEQRLRDSEQEGGQ